AGLRIDDGTDARTLGAVEHLVDADRLDQQLECVPSIQNRVEVKLAQPVAEALALSSKRLRVEAAELERHGAAAVRDEDLQGREIVEHPGVDQTVNRGRLL